MHICHLNIDDVVMVDIDGNAVPCTVLAIELGAPGAVHLQDHGSSRCFWRSATSLLTCKRFDGTITSYRGYSDYLKHRKPDVVVHFLKPAGTRALAEPRPNKAERAEVVNKTSALADAVLKHMSVEDLLSMLTSTLLPTTTITTDPNAIETETDPS